MSEWHAGRKRSFIWRGHVVTVQMVGNLWVASYIRQTDTGSAFGSMSWSRGTSPADVAGGIMRELRSTL